LDTIYYSSALSYPITLDGKRANRLRKRSNRVIAYQDVLRVGNGSDDSGSEHKLFPGLSKVEDVDSFSVALVDVWSHQISTILGSNVGLKTRKVTQDGWYTLAASIKATSTSLVLE
jgi:hypothetical protein